MKASQAIAADFRRLIARGELKAGDALPVESQLVDTLGASKGVVREALRILETEGLVEVRRGLGGGPRVRHPSLSEAAQGMGVYLQLGDVPVLDVWVARDRIIGGAVERLAVERAQPAIDALESCLNALAARVGDFDEYYPLLLDIEETAVRLAGSTTEHVLVVALRHIIAAELDAATRAVVDVSEALDAERFVTDAWRQAIRNIKAGRRKTARQAYESQADLVRNGIAERNPDATVGGLVNLASLAPQRGTTPVES